jgi:hypothetical protein
MSSAQIMPYTCYSNNTVSSFFRGCFTYDGTPYEAHDLFTVGCLILKFFLGGKRALCVFLGVLQVFSPYIVVKIMSKVVFSAVQALKIGNVICARYVF